MYAKIGNTGMMSGYPRRISDDWEDLPDDLDTAVHWPPIYQWQRTASGSYIKALVTVGRTYFFKVSNIQLLS